MANGNIEKKAIMLEQFQLLSEAHLAIDHVHRLKRLARQRPMGRRLQRRVRAIEEAALRMELEVRARSVYRWRVQDNPPYGRHFVKSCSGRP